MVLLETLVGLTLIVLALFAFLIALTEPVTKILLTIKEYVLRIFQSPVKKEPETHV
jgi:hypothetical protein